MQLRAGVVELVPAAADPSREVLARRGSARPSSRSPGRPSSRRRAGAEREPHGLVLALRRSGRRGPAARGRAIELARCTVGTSSGKSRVRGAPAGARASRSSRRDRRPAGSSGVWSTGRGGEVAVEGLADDDDEHRPVGERAESRRVSRATSAAPKSLATFCAAAWAPAAGAGRSRPWCGSSRSVGAFARVPFGGVTIDVAALAEQVAPRSTPSPATPLPFRTATVVSRGGGAFGLRLLARAPRRSPSSAPSTSGFRNSCTARLMLVCGGERRTRRPRGRRSSDLEEVAGRQRVREERVREHGPPPSALPPPRRPRRSCVIALTTFGSFERREKLACDPAPSSP